MITNRKNRKVIKMYKSKRQKNKSFDWYGLSQRFSIRKYHFGAASVLLGTALILGAAQSTAKAEEATADNKTEAVTSTPKDGEGAISPTNVTLPVTEARTGAPVLDKKELSEEEIAKLAAEASKKDGKPSESATTEKSEVADKEKATLVADSTDKKSEKAVDDKADKKDEKKAENPIAATKTILEQLTSEAEVLNTTAANYAEKKVEDKSSKEAIAAAVAAAKVEIAASKKVLNEKDVTAEQLNLQLQRISSAIEAVYTEMKRAGHIGKVEAVLDEANAANAGGRDSAPQELTPVLNAEDLTDSEVAAIIKQIRTSNPGLTNEDVITVNKTRGSQAAGFTTITYADGSGSTTFEPGQVMVASAGIKNLEQLSSSINWFNFASATITYTDGTVATPVRYYENTTATPDGRLYKQLDANTGTTGRTLEGYFSMYRDVTLGRDYTVDGVLYAKGTKLKSTDDAFLKMGIAKYEQHIYYSGGKQGETNVKIPNAANPTTYTTKKLGEIYEVLQVGMKFDVPTRVEGYRLNATVTKLAPKEVATDPQKGQGNRLRYYTNGVNGKNPTDTTAVYDIVDAPDGGGRGVDVLLTTQDKTNSYLRKAGIETTYRERREGDSETNPTGTKREGLTAFSSSRDHSNFGVSLYLQATYNGQLVPVNAVVADADESGLREYSQFETDGGAWEKLMEVHWDNRRLDNNGDAIVDGNGTSILVDKNGKAYVDNAGNPMFINKYWQTTREDVVTNGITEAKYYLTTASGAKVLVSEKDNLPILDAEGNPTILDSTGTRMTTTKDGMFQNGYIGKDDNNQNVFKIGSTNGIKVRQVLDAEGRPILRGGSIPGLAAFILPSGVKTTSLETVNGKKKLFDTTDGKHEEITRDFYGNSILWTDGSVDGRVSATDTLKFSNPNKKPVKLTTAGDIGDMRDAGYNPSEWVSPSAYGNKTFGSFSTAVGDGYRLPIGLTEGVSNLSFYGNSTSSVSGFIGFVVTDGGDAPSSYGSAKHVIGNFNKVVNNQEITATQPYLGEQPGDPDFRSTVNEKSGDWVLDDLVMTNKYIEKDLGAGETDPTKQVKVTNQKGETGTFIVTDSGNAVIRKEDGTQVAINQGDVLTTPDPATGLPMIGIYNSTTKKLGVGAIPDEGEAQLLDSDAVDNTGKKIKGEYTLRQASDTEYVLYGVKANPGVNNKEAYLRGWVDFNGNGKFDVDEASELIKVTPGQKTYDVKFKNVAQLLDTSIDKAGVRLRIALEEQDIRESTGLAGSGEVEDFQTYVTHYPRSTRHETKDYQGQEQGIKFPTNAMFIANGKSKDSGYKNWAQINNVEVSPKIVLTDKVVDTTKVTTLDPNAEKDKTDLGTKGIVSKLRKNSDGSIYTKDGKVFIDKNDSTVLTGRLVEVKDKNNKVLGTALEVVNPNNKKTEYLMSEYTEYDSVGNKVGTYKINPATTGDNKEITGGFYETAVTFKPELGFVGKAKGIAIRAWDDNNNSTGWEASAATIAASENSTTLADKDRINGNVNNGVNNYKSMDTTYIPTVIDIKPVGKDETTIDEQGKKQSATPKIPDHGTVESINNEHIDEAKIDKAHVLIDKSKPITFSDVKNIPGKLYDKDTPVDKETTLTYEDGGTETFKPVDKVPASTIIAENKRFDITGSGNVEVSNVRIVKGTFSSNLVPAGSVLEGASPIAPKQITVIRNGVEVTVNAGERLQKGDQLVTPLPIEGGNQHTIWKVTFQKGDYIPQATGGYNPKLVSETSVDKLIGTKGDSITLNGNTYVNNNNIIPKGTRTAGQAIPLTTLTLPKATHVNPTTGEVTTVERRYTKIDIENGVIEIENEGTYTLVPKTTTNEKGEKVYEDATVVFTPHPSFVGVGTGVTIKQPDVDYPAVENPDSVTRRYGTDYGYATYTPTVTPNLTATITRKIHYVYEGDKSTAAKDKTPILTIDGKPVINEQTLTYNRDYIVMSQDGQTEKDITVASAMTLESPITVDRYVRKGNQVVKEATTVTELKPGDVVKAGTELKAGTVIVGAWKAINPENDHFTNIISPTLKGYTAEVQLPENEYTKSEKDGVQSHVRSVNQTTVGVYTPTIKDGKVNTQDVGSYEPMVSEVRADDKDNFDVYVYYKADKQVARVVYIDMDAANNANQGVLETHTGSKLEAEKSATDTTTKVDTLLGDSATRIKYSTAATIAKYEAMGYELKRDGFTNDDDGNRIVGGRKFDEESVADSANAGEKPQNQTFYVFLGHKRDTGAKTETADVTRTINYKYKDGGAKAAESVTETLNFKRNITIDMALAAEAFPEDTATFNAENTKATPEEKEAAKAKYDAVVAKYNAAAEKAKEDPTTSEALRTADKTLTTAEKSLADAKKANNALVITSESTQAQRDAKAATEAALQAAQEAYNNALTDRDTARTNYLAADNSALAKAVITTQQALEAENVKVEAATVKYNEKIKDVNLTAQERTEAIKEYAKVLAAAEKAAEATTAAKTAFEDAKDEEETLNDAKIAEAVKNKAIQDRAETTQAAKDAARHAYYDAVIAKVKEEAKKETPDKNKVAAVSFGEWKALGSTATNLPANEQLSEAEKQSDNAFNHVTSPTIAGYLADKAAIDRTDAIDPLADDYEVDVFYDKGEQRATVKFVEVDPTNTDTVVTPGVAEDLVEIGKTGNNFATLTTDAIAATIKKLQDKGYTLVSNGFANPGTGVNNTTFDNDPTVDQEFVVKVKATVVDVPSFDPTKPESNENPKPTPGVTPIDPSNPSGPKWTEDLIKAVKVQEEVTRTIKYVYEDGTEVPAEKLTDVADKKVKTLKFTRPGKINVVTGEITYGDWSANQTFEAVTSPTIENYTAAVAGVTPTTPDVPAKTGVTATDKDFEEVVVYKKAKPVTITPTDEVPNDDPNTPVDPNNPIQPGKPIDPSNPDGPKWTKELIDKLRDARKEEVTRTITYKYSDKATDLKEADAAKAGADVKENVTVTNTVTFKRPVTIDPITKEFTYGDWVADNNDTTLEGKAELPKVDGYIATGDVDASKKDVTDVKATDKDITDEVVYKALGKYVPVVPAGFNPPIIENPQYPNSEDPSKPGDPTTTTKIPYVPGLTPLNPTTGQPLEPVTPGNPKDGYKVPELPADPTQNTTITYVKDGSQVAVVHFVDEKGNAVNESVIETGDTGGTISTTKADAVKTALEAKGYEVVAPKDALYTADKEGFYKEADRTFDAVSDKATGAADEKVPSQQYYVIVKAKEITVPPTDETPTPNQPIIPGNNEGPKWTPELIKELEDGRKEEVKRTIKYIYSDGTAVEDSNLTSVADKKEKTLTFKRTAVINPVTGKITFKNDWTPANQTFEEVTSPTIDNAIVDRATVPSTDVTATADDINELVVYKKLGSYVPVVPEGITVPPGTDTTPKVYPKDPTDPTRPGTPTTVIPEIPGTTPVGPNGKPLEKNPNGGYNVPPVPTDPTQNTTITYVKDGSQVAVVHFIEVNSATDKTEKGAVAQSIVDTGDTGKDFTKAADVTATIQALEAKGYTVVENGYRPTDKFDADSTTNQVYKVLVTVTPIPVTPDDVTPTPDTPIDPNNPTGPKWTPELIKELEDGRKEEVKRTINYIYSDGTPVPAEKLTDVADKKEKTLTFKRSATINPVTGKITFGNWTPEKQSFEAVTSPAIDNYTPNKASVEAKEVTPTADDITETVIYSTSKVPVNPVTPDGNVDPNTPVPNDPKGRTYKELGLVEEVTRTVHYVYEDGAKAADDKVQTITFTRTADIDPVTGALSNIGTWTVKANENTTFEPETTEPIAGYIASAAKSTEVTGVQATDKDTEETIIYRKLGSYVPVVPAGVTPPADFDKTPKPYPNATPEDPTKPGTPTTTTTIPEIPGTTPVGPDGTPLTKNPNGGYDLPPVPKDPTQNTTITYVKDGSQVAVVHFIEVNSETDKTEKGAVATSIVDTGDAGKAFTKAADVTSTINALKAKGYTVVENEYPENGTFDADATTNQEYKVLVTVKPVTITPNTDVPNDDPNTPVDPNNPIQPGKPIDPSNPEGPKWTKELIDKLRDARKEEVTRTITYKYSSEASELKADDVAKAGQQAADTVTNTVTFKRSVTIDPVTKEFTYGDWEATNGTTLAGKAALPVVPGYVATGDVEASKKDVENVKATDKDITQNVVYKTVGKYVPVIPEGITPPANTNVDPKPYNNDPQDGSKVKDPDPTNPVVPGTTTPIVPQIPGTTPIGPDGKPLKPVDPADPSKGYVPPTPTDPTKDTSIIYVKDGSQVAVVHFVDEKGRAVNESVVETGDTGNTISKTNVDAVKAKLEAKGYTVVEPTDALYTTDKEGFYKEATRTFDAVSDKSTGTAGEKVPSQQYYVIVKAKEIPADPTKPGTTPGTDTPTNPTPGTDTPAKPGDKIPGDPLNRTYGDLGLVEEVTRTINYVKNDGTKAADPVKETLTFTRKAKINAVTGEVTYLAADGVTPVASKDDAPWTAANGTEFKAVKSPTGAEKPELANYTPSKAEVEAKTGVTATDEDIVETVVYNQTTETVDPKDPNYDPEKPLDPNNPNGPKYKDLKLAEVVNRTIKYTYADDVEDTTKRGTVAAPEFTTKVEFTRTATINKATGEVSYSDWAAKDNDTTLEKDTKDLPLIPGYVATGDLDKIKEDVTNVNATDKDITQNVVYKDLGKYVPVVPEGTTPPTIENPKYPNHPTDPTKPGEPTTTIPNVPGLTPLDPSTGKPLEPKDPNDLTQGYKPPVPQDPTQNTTITYVKDGSQVSVVHFVDESGKAVHTSFVEAGNAGAKFAKAGEVTKVVDELKAAGYVVVPNKAGQAEYPGEAGVFDSEDDKGEKGVSQVYYVTVAKTVPVTPTTPQNPNEDPQNPKPGDPIDPKNPNGPKWTKDALDKLNNIKSVTRTITYIKDGTDEEVSPTEAPKVTNKVSFTRTVVVNPKDGSVVGYDTTGDGIADVAATDTTSGWKAAGTAKFAEKKSPVVKGYVVKPNQDTQGDLVEADGSKVKASTTDLTVDSPNQDLKVRYVPVGTWTPKVPEGETPIDPIPYPNDPTDPGKVVDPNKPTDPNEPNKPSVPVVPHIPGTTPKDPDGNPLKPVDPNDPSKGYVPPTPKTPTENTEINYEKDTQEAVTKFVDPSGNPIPGVNNIEETGKSGEPLTKTTEVTTEIAKLIAKGYDLVSNNYGKDNNGNFDKDKSVKQEYTVVLTPHVEPIKPFDPTNPNDPNKPEPGKPIDPNNPDGPKWTKELIDKLNTTKHVTRTISYVDKDGNKVEYTDKDGNKSTADVTDKVTFTREAKINVVTGTIEYGKWTPVNNDTTFDKVTSPVAPGYVLKDPAQKEVAETTGLTENSKDETIKVVYVPVGKVTITVPPGVTPPTPVTDTPYENVPGEPGKVVPPSPTKPTDPQDPNSPKVPVIPHIPGTTPQVPKDPTKPVDPNTNPLVPLEPVTPGKPEDGYKVPPVPTDPNTDTPIYYVNDKQKAITNFVDNNGKVVSDPVVDQGDSGSRFTKSGDVESKIKELVKKGYVVTSNEYPSDDKDRVFDKDKDKDQIFNVTLTPLIVPTDPNSPDKPQVPTDPTKPVGPNNPLKPVTPSTPEPGKPVFPEDPNSPVWPETVKDLVTESSATRTITYVDHNGKEVSASHTETIKFKRTAKVNLVTGEIIYGEWTVEGNDTILDGNKLPKVDGYIARGGDIKDSQEDIKAEAGKNITQTVVYAKLGSWIPRLPEGQTNVPPTPYPNDPTDPTKPGTDKPRVPYVPGFIPVDPNGNPLKPVDPNDPTKGYEVPDVPADPTQDTPIKYIPVPTPNNGGGNNGGGGGNIPTPQPQPEPSPAPNPVPVTPETPEQPVAPVTPEQPAEPATPQYMDGQRELPNTGTEANSSLAALGLLGALSGFGLIARKKRKDEE